MTQIIKAIKYITELNRYSDEVITTIQDALHKADGDKAKLLRCRVDGVDLIRTNDIDFAKEKFKNWNCEWHVVEDEPKIEIK